MKKKLIAALFASMLSFGVGAAAMAASFPWWKIIEIAYEIYQDSQSGSTQCATKIDASDEYRVLKCEGDGCRWVPGIAVSWGGKC